MTWCDKLSSTPGVGFQLNTRFLTSDAILTSLAPVLDAVVDNGNAAFGLDKLDAFLATITTNEGFNYSIDHRKVVVTFNHRVRAKQTSAGPPTMELLSNPRPFTQLLPDVINKVIAATLALPEANKRTANRVGIYSVTKVSRDEAPPGILRFIEYVNRPWQATNDQFHIQITAPLSETAKVRDRCIHTVTLPEDGEELLTINLDWQRSFLTPLKVDKSTLQTALDAAKGDAVRYFEDVAEGSRFDAEVLRAQTP